MTDNTLEYRYPVGSAGDMAMDLADYDVEHATHRELMLWAYKWREQYYMDQTEGEIRRQWEDLTDSTEEGPF